MIINVNIDIEELYIQGKNYKHKRLTRCPRCKSICIWGHGYTGRYFDGYSNKLWLKRWRCTDCNCIIFVKPAGYFSRHHRTIKGIYKCIRHRIHYGRWIRGPDLSRQRQGHWVRALKKNIKTHLGVDNSEKLSEGFQKLINRGQCPVLRSV
jgi:hypothetical protein